MMRMGIKEINARVADGGSGGDVEVGVEVNAGSVNVAQGGDRL